MFETVFRVFSNEKNPKQKLDQTLVDAVTSGNLSGAEKAIRLGADPNALDCDDFSPLMHSIHRNDFEMSELLIEKGADPKARNLQGLTAMYVATCYDDWKTMKLLANSGVDPNEPCDFARTPLQVAAADPDCVEALRYLLYAKVDLNLREKGGFRTAAMFAYSKGSITAFRRLLEAKATFTHDERLWCEIEREQPDLFQLGQANKLPSSVQLLFNKLNSRLSVVASPS